MLRSMTGYGRGKYEKDFREYSVEIKSVNNRYSDVLIKIPRNLSFLEETIKKLISNSIVRGKVEVFITYANNSDKGRNIAINSELAKKYIEEMKKLAEETNDNRRYKISAKDALEIAYTLFDSVGHSYDELAEISDELT